MGFQGSAKHGFCVVILWPLCGWSCCVHGHSSSLFYIFPTYVNMSSSLIPLPLIYVGRKIHIHMHTHPDLILVTLPINLTFSAGSSARGNPRVTRWHRNPSDGSWGCSKSPDSLPLGTVLVYPWGEQTKHNLPNLIFSRHVWTLTPWNIMISAYNKSWIHIQRCFTFLLICDSILYWMFPLRC